MAVTVAGARDGLLGARAVGGVLDGRRRAVAPPVPWTRAYRLVAGGLDLLAAAAAVILVVPGLAAVEAAALAVAGGGALVALVALHHGYDTRTAGHGPREYRAVLRGGTAWAAVALALAVATGADVSRPALLGALPLTVAAVLATRAAERALLRRRRRQGQMTRPTVVVAAPEHLPDLLLALTESAEHGLRPVGVCTTPGAEVPGTPVLGSLEAAATAAADAGAEVVVASATLGAAALRRLAWALEGRGIDSSSPPTSSRSAPPGSGCGRWGPPRCCR